MKSKYILILFFLLAYSELFASWDDTLMQKNKHCFSFEIGVHYRNYYSEKYIRPYFDTIVPKEMRGDGKAYYGFSYIPSFSYQTSILYHYKINKFMGFSAGLELINKKTILTTNIDSAIKYQNGDIIKYIYNDIYFEVPLILELNYKKMAIGLGANFSKLHINNHYEYHLYQPKIVRHRGSSIDENINLFYATVTFSYIFSTLKNQNNFNIFVGMNYYGRVLYVSAKTVTFSFGISYFFNK